MTSEDRLVLFLEKDSRYPYCYTNSIEVLRYLNEINVFHLYLYPNLNEFRGKVLILDPDKYDIGHNSRSFESIFEQISSIVECLGVDVRWVDTNKSLEFTSLNSGEIFVRKIASILNIDIPECKFD